ncbi:hypothetical protein E2C01_066146 [Portunus trituberculatus]|uniref:Uncharacterized protein n=1 Tax=Portunus trituberculatus TaxID=210409 RepID=A0A5B7HPH7_PORTR|nr:hypothetical protein [Portunus trituberculatus]
MFSPPPLFFFNYYILLTYIINQMNKWNIKGITGGRKKGRRGRRTCAWPGHQNS